MGVFKEIPKADGSGITTFYRLDNDKDTVETTSTGGTETMIDYNKALNKPSINNVVLVGNKTLDELGIQPKGDYITEVPSEYITEEELNQKQYATESYVLDKIANIEHFSRQIVDELPLVGKDNVIYLVRKEGAGDDIYNEYIWTGTSYELFGSTATDLSDYYNKDSVNKLLDTKVDKQEGKGLSSNDYTNAEKSKLASLENYDDSELRAAIDSLHNYDDTEIRQEINKLSNESEAMSEKIEDIDKTNDYKLEAVRLIKSGDYWIWKDSADNLIDYFKARDLLGTENCILIMEQLDSDGKSIPADYKIDGDRIRILYKDLENLNHEMYMGPPDKDEVEGTDIIVDNGAEATLFALSGDGKSEQVTTTGKNKFDTFSLRNRTQKIGASTGNIYTLKPKTQYTVSTNMVTSSSDDSIAIIGTPQSANAFIFVSSDTTMEIISSNAHGVGTINNISRTLMTDDTGNIFVGIRESASSSLSDLISKGGYVQIEEGSTATSYEPYTGGQPSPSPDYPQEISSIEGNLEFNCRGKNIFTKKSSTQTSNGITNVFKDNTLTYNGTATLNYSNCVPAGSFKITKGTYTFSITNPLDTSITMRFQKTIEYNSSSFEARINKGETSVTFTLPDDFNYFYFYLLTREGDTYSGRTSIQMEKGTQATEYEPYQSNQVTFNLNDEKLRSVGDVKDELVVDLDTGDYYKVENVGEVVLDGSENWEYTDTYNYFRCPNFDFGEHIPLESKNSLQISNYFKIINDWSTFRDSVDLVGIFRISNSGYKICIRNTNIKTTENFKIWLNENNTIIDYQLATSTIKQLGTLSAEDLAKLSTFDGYNNLFINTNLGYMNIRVTYSTNTNYNENIILGDDSYYYGIVDNKQSLPEGKAKGTLCQTKDTKDFYIYNGEEWAPVDKTASFDLSNYLSKDNTTPYSPSDRYNPATKQYVDTNIQGLKIPTKVSQLENDSNYITENTNTLVNYYNKNNTYNKKEVDALIDSSGLTPVSVTLNGQKTTDANFYAPISGGTANQILISQGDAAPVWQNNTAVQTVNQDIKLVISDTQPEAPSSGFILWVDSTK